MRPLSEAERQVLDLMLGIDFPGATALRVQAASARVSGGCDCGCPTVDLVLEGTVPLASVTSRTPVNAEVEGVPGGGLIVFVDDGRLSGLEFYAAEDPMPREFPALEQIHPYV